MQITDVLLSIRRHWRIAVGIALATAAVVGFFLVNRETATPPARFRATTDVLIPAVDAKTGAAPDGVPATLLHGQIELASQRATIDAALDRAKVGADERGTVAVNASLSANGDLVGLTAVAPSATLANDVSDAYAATYALARRDKATSVSDQARTSERQALAALQSRLATVEGDLRGAGLLAFPPVVPDGTAIAVPGGVSSDTALLLYERNGLHNAINATRAEYGVNSAEVVAPNAFATVVQHHAAGRITPAPSSPLVPILVIIGVGLLVAFAAPVLLDRFDQSVNEPGVAGRAFRAPVLGVIPAVPRSELDAFVPAGSTWDTAFRALAATSLSTDRLPRAIAVMSPVGEMQDFVAANFAAALAGMGLQVALIGTLSRQDWFLGEVVEELSGAEPASDGSRLSDIIAGAMQTDPHPSTIAVADRPQVGPDDPVWHAATEAELADVEALPGVLRGAQEGTIGGSVRDLMARTDIPNLWIIPPAEDGGEPLPLDGLPPLLEALSEDGFDTVVIASPSLLDDPTATIISWTTRSVLWVAEAGRVHAKQAEEGAARLELASIEPFGVALVSRGS